MLTWLSGSSESNAEDSPARWLSAKVLQGVHEGVVETRDVDRPLVAMGHPVREGARLFVEASIASEEATRVTVGAAVQRTDDGTTGVVEAIRSPAPEIASDPTVVCQFAAPSHLEIGDEIPLRITARPLRGLALPWSAIVRVGEFQDVVVIEQRLPSGSVRAVRRHVRIDSRAGDGHHAIVTHGLTDGEHVVVTAAFRLVEQL